MDNKELRKSWIDIRNNNEINYSFFKNYYYSKCKDCKHEEEFNQFFPTYLQKYQNTIVNYIDNVMQLVTVRNKKGDVIKYL